MWSIHVVPNNGTSCIALEEQYQTHIMERKRNVRRGGGEVSCQKLLSQVVPCYQSYSVSCLVFQAVVLVHF